jgi:hypothetical protein
MNQYLLKYTSLNSDGYKLVFAKTEKEAIKKLEKELFYLSQLFITSETIK